MPFNHSQAAWVVLFQAWSIIQERAKFCFNFIFTCAIKYWRNRPETQAARSPTQMGFQHLSDIHTTWHAERIQDDID